MPGRLKGEYRFGIRSVLKRGRTPDRSRISTSRRLTPRVVFIESFNYPSRRYHREIYFRRGSRYVREIMHRRAPRRRVSCIKVNVF